MSWWDIGKDDVLGDRPADIIGNTLKAIARTCEEQGGQRPTLQQLLDNITSVLRTNLEEFSSDGTEVSVHRLVVKLDSRLDVKSTGGAKTKDDQLVLKFCDAFQAIAKEYEERWARKPRLRELLETITFVLAARPEAFVSDGEAIHIQEIVAE
jgi:hypothetical protein